MRPSILGVDMVRALVIASIYGSGGQHGNNGAAITMQMVEFSGKAAFEDFKDRCKKVVHTTVETVVVFDSGDPNG